MRIRSWISTVLSTLLLASAVLGGAVAQAAPNPNGLTCTSPVPQQIRVQSVGYTCLDHAQYFDVTPASADNQQVSAIAISGDGKRAVWARAIPDPNCNDGGNARQLAVYPGVVTALNTTWKEPVIISLGCRTPGPDMSIATNTKGTDIGVVFSTDSASTLRFNFYAVLSWPLNGSLEPRAFQSISDSPIEDTSVGLKASMSANGKWMLFVGGFDTGGRTSNRARVVKYEIQSGNESRWGFIELPLDSGISADGSTFFLTTRSSANTTPASANLKTYVCRAVETHCAFDIFRMTNVDAVAKVKASMNDAATELALSWTRPLGEVTRHFATAFPITSMLGQTIDVPISARTITTDDTRNAEPLPIYLNPAGNRLWVGGLDRAMASMFTLTATVNKYQLTWADTEMNGVSIPDSDAKAAFVVSRSGRLVSAVTNSNLGMGGILVADKNVGPATWESKFLFGAAGWYPNDFQIALSDDGSRYVAAFKTSTNPRAIVTTGVLLPFQFVKKAPIVSGVRKVGSKLTVAGDTWGVAGGRNTYQWMRDGQFIQNATSATYKLTNDDAGHAITVSVRHTKAGYYDRYLTAGSTAIVTGGRIAAVTPQILDSIFGYPYLNTELRVDLSNWAPSGLTFTYVWKAGGVTVGTGATYLPQMADGGKTITVTVTASKPGCASVSKTSAPTLTVVADLWSV